MCRENDRLSLFLHLQHDILQEFGVHRIQTAERLIQDDQLRLMDDRHDELQLLLHSSGKLLDLFGLPLRQVELFQPVINFPPCSTASQTLQFCQEQEELSDFHLGVKPPVLGKVSHFFLDSFVHFMFEDLDRAFIRNDDVHHHPDGRRFSRTVGSQEAVDRPLRNPERETFDCIKIAKPLCDVFNLQRIHDLFL